MRSTERTGREMHRGDGDLQQRVKEGSSLSAVRAVSASCETTSFGTRNETALKKLFWPLQL